jgi:squalene-associated FAD-dependent desaturase
VAVVGGGYAGLAAAVELAACGIPVTVFEAGRVLGGRARRVEIDGLALDNGQHLLSGAYRETLRLMERVGVDPRQALRRLPLELSYPGTLRLAAPRLPAPLHLAWALARARGAGSGEKLGAMQFMNCLKAARFELHRDITVAELLDDHGQQGALRRLVWEPLCVAALNTPADRASARVFLAVLRDTLGARRAASDLLLPKVDLSHMFPEAAADFVRHRGGAIRTGARIGRLARTDAGFLLDGGAGEPYSRVVLAVAPQHLAALIDGLPELAATRSMVAAFSYEPILTCYLAYDEPVRLAAPMLGVDGGFTQWLFDRGQCGAPQGLLAAVISARGRHQELSHAALAAKVSAETAVILGHSAAPRWTRVIEERRATFACTPGLVRPPCETPLPGLYLAGDYVASDYPATIEAAVRSGVRVARACLGALRAP